MPSLFKRATRYEPSVLANPRENRLTEVFAATLERTADLASLLVSNWLRVDGIEAGVSVRTQRATGGGYVDLELAFGAPTNPDLIVWVEVKHGAGESGSQLETYARDIERVPASERKLVLLAPRDSMPPVRDPTVIRIEWQQVASFLRHLPKSQEDDPVHRFLVREFLAYLEEEGLTDAPALTAAHALSLAVGPSAERTLSTLLELTFAHVEKAWGKPADYRRIAGSQKPNFAPWWWASYDTAPRGKEPAWKSQAWFDWALFPDSARAEGRDSYAFFSGVTFERSRGGSPASIVGNEAWLRERSAAGFEYVQDSYWRLVRYLYPEQLLSETTIEDQAAKLGRWIVESFALLAKAPPPK
jgi:hypothetical protein